MLKLIHYLVAENNGALPEIPNCLYAYILAGNGVFLKANREGLDVLMPVSSIKITGLPALVPYVHLSCRVPKNLFLTALELSRQSFPNEMLFWFNMDDSWSMDVPRQFTRPAGVTPCDPVDARGTRALIDLHSHGGLSPFFSRVDDKDEQGFRIYAILGEVDKTPKVYVRVGIYGHYFDIPASTVFDLPNEIVDVYQGEWSRHESTVE